MAVTIRLMGPVGVQRDGRVVEIGGPKQRMILGVLALSAGRRVSTERLVDVVWSEDPPASARRTVQSYVASLRGTLGSDAPLVSSQGGYVLEISPGDVDLLAFQEAVVAALDDVEVDSVAAAAALVGALGEWDVPFDGLRAGSRLGELAAPFEELQLQAVEGLAAAQIAGSDAADAVRMLEGLVREHPTREHLWLHLAQGLAASGRRDAALTAIQRAREALREHLGVDPSGRLADFEAELLTGDPRSIVETSSPAGGAHAQPTPSSASVGVEVPGNLPERVAPLLYRQGELSALAARLADERLITIHGPAGVGKTQTALELCRQARGEYPGGCWLVDLSQAESDEDLDDLLPTTIGAITGRVSEPSRLGSLVLFDNCEHLLAAAGRAVQDLLARSPGVRLVCTSRQPLGVPGESVVRLEPLSTTKTSGDPDSDATALLIELANRATGVDFVGSDREVLERCAARLGGLPLSIELAAACLRTMTPAELSDELVHQIDVLHRDVSGEHDRHISLRAAIEWSYGLLEPADRHVFDQLSVFAGLFARDDVEAVIDGDDVAVVPAVRRLAEQSLVQVSTTDGRTSFTLLDALKEFAAERLLMSGHDGDVRDRHAARVLDVVSAALEQGDHSSTARRLEQSLADLRNATRWLRQQGRPKETRRALNALSDAAARCGRNHLETGAARRALEVANEALHDRPADLDLREIAANAAWRVDALDEGAEHAEAMIGEAQRLDRTDRAAVGFALLARIRLEQRRHDDLSATLDALDGLLDRLEPRARAETLVQIAQMHMLSYRLDAAVDAADRALRVAAELGERAIREQALVEKGSALLTSERPEEGIRILYETLPFHHERGDHVRVARVTYNLAYAVQNPDELRPLIDQCVDAATRAGWTGNDQSLYTWLAILEGDLAEARRSAARHLALATHIDVVRAHLTAALLAIEAGDIDDVQRIVDALDQEHPTLVERAEVVERLLVDLRLDGLHAREPRNETGIGALAPFPVERGLHWLVLSLDDVHETGEDHRLLAPVHRDLVASQRNIDAPEALYIGGWVDELHDPFAARRSYERALQRTTGERFGDRVDPTFSAGIHLGLARLDEGAGNSEAAIAHLERVIGLLQNWAGPRRQHAIAALDRLSNET